MKRLAFAKPSVDAKYVLCDWSVALTECCASFTYNAHRRASGVVEKSASKHDCMRAPIGEGSTGEFACGDLDLEVFAPVLEHLLEHSLVSPQPWHSRFRVSARQLDAAHAAGTCSSDTTTGQRHDRGEVGTVVQPLQAEALARRIA